jgi:hypothetical protein
VFVICCAINTSPYSNLFVLLQTILLGEADHTLYKIFYIHKIDVAEEEAVKLFKKIIFKKGNKINAIKGIY